MVPKMEKDPTYLAKNDLEVVDRKGQVVGGGNVSADALEQLRSGKLEQVLAKGYPYPG